MNWKTLLAVGAILFSGTICAQPLSPDITLSGNDFDAISGYYDGEPNDEGQENCTWYPDGDAIFTLWDHGGPVNHFGHCLWVMYIVDLDAGYWRVGLNAISVGAGIKDRQWYPWFEVLVELESTFLSQAGMDSAVVYVPASDEEVQQGYQWFRIPEDGLYAFKYTWLNDKSGEGFDVNIRIDSVFFDQWPPRRN